MPSVERSRELVRFEQFELNVRTAELRNQEGALIRLSEQPLRILIALLERPGELVLREDLRKRLWPNDTVVEFEHSISVAMNRLRQALGESAESPRFIETLARRGYRWKCPVEWVVPEREATDTEPKTLDGNLVGKKVSHYRVLEILGGGGMGVVYKAEDIKLGRRVALKFLPEELADDPKSMERFEREARAASALNHPNICTIHEVEEHEGRHFLVMELLEGETLRDTIAGASNSQSPSLDGLLPVAKCLSVAKQIAQGLAAAHEQGIIHRDIKPANIFLTRDGRAKILDFGVAKLLDIGFTDETAEKYPSETKSNQPIQYLSLTRTGLAIGTAGYMSPEQVRGERLDARTDLFSFGLVLYEMATGRRAFTGETAPMLREAILQQAPQPVRELNPNVPAKLAAVIGRALEKDRAARYQTASEMCAELDNLQRESLEKRPRWIAVGAGLAAIALIATAVFWFSRRPAPSHARLEFRQRQLTVNSSENPVTGGGISPDGKYLAYTDSDGIHLKLVESGETQSIPSPATFQGSPPTWEIGSWLPDSTHFFAIAEFPQQLSSLWNISVAGNMRRMADEGNPWGVSPDGSLLAITRNNDREIWLMDPNGGQPRKLCESDDGSFRAVQWSPDGKTLAYIRSRVVDGKNESQIESRDLKGGPATVLVSGRAMHDVSQLEDGFRDLNWLPDGRLIYVGGEPDIHGTSCNLWEVSVDFHSGKVISEPERFTNWAGFCVTTLSRTADGKRLSFNRSSDVLTVYTADFDPVKTRLSTPRKLTFTDDMSSPTGWTSDGSAVFIRSNREATWGIYKQPISDGVAEPIVTKLQDVSWTTPVTFDGKWLLYAFHDDSDGVAPDHIMRVSLSGGPPQEIVKGHYRDVRCAITGNTCVLAETPADGKLLVFTAFDPMTGRGRELSRFADGDANEFGWDLSPDGTQVVLYRDFDTHFQILTLGSGERPREVRTQNQSHLRNLQWAAHGKALFASAPTLHGAQLVYVDLQGNLHPLWELKGYNIFLAARPSRDGRHLAIQGSAGTSNLWMIENF